MTDSVLDLASMAMDPKEYTDGYVQPGWLEYHGGDSYISWRYGEIVLDGDFSIEDLRAIVAHMEKFQP